jgi:hypothetical protein
MATRVFTSFDYDHDEFLRTALVGQSKHDDSPFEICDWSVKEPFTGDWKKKVRERIKRCGQMIVICGEHTHTATGVSAELEIAQEEGIRFRRRLTICRMGNCRKHKRLKLRCSLSLQPLPTLPSERSNISAYTLLLNQGKPCT